jgi:hypothetical protein
MLLTFPRRNELFRFYKLTEKKMIFDFNNKAISIKSGEATFEVIKATEKPSKNDANFFYMNIKLNCTQNNASAHVYDNLMPTPNMLWKMEKFLKACGKESWMEKDGGQANIIPSDIFGLKGKCLIEEGTYVKDGVQQKKWIIKDYIPSVISIENSTDLNDAIPF